MAAEPAPFHSADSSVPGGDEPELRTLLHRLNNQLGIILANAELLEKKLGDDASRARASQIAASVIDAIGTTRDIDSWSGPTRK